MRGGYFILGLVFCFVTGPAVAQPAYTPEQLAVAFAKGWRPLQPPAEYRKPYEGVRVNGPRNLPSFGPAIFPTLAGLVISRLSDR